MTVIDLGTVPILDGLEAFVVSVVLIINGGLVEVFFAVKSPPVSAGCVM
jgi:hypothetical protein